MKTKNETLLEKERLEKTEVLPGQVHEFLESRGSSPLQNKISLAELLKRPEMSYEIISEIDPDRKPLSFHSITQLEVQIKYDGYITKQLAQVERFKRLEEKRLSEELDYMAMEGLRIEARQKLAQFRPVSVGQASRISGVSPADINVLLIHLEKMRRSGRGGEK